MVSSNYLANSIVYLANNGKMILTVDKFGRVLIPKPIRQALTLEPGSKVEISINSETKSLTMSPAREEEYESKIVYTDWGFPMIETKESLPEDFDTVAFIKGTYEEYFDRKFGNV